MNNPHMKQVWLCPECGQTFPYNGRDTHAVCRDDHRLNKTENVTWIPKQDANAQMYFRSGEVSSNEPMVSFFYELLRDHVSPGVIEEVVRHSVAEKTHFTNGWLAKYATDVVDRLNGVQV